MKMLKERIPQQNDQEQSQKAYDLLINFLCSHTEYDPNHWVAAMSTAISESFYNSGLTHDQFIKELNGMANYYKYFWDEK